MKSLKQLPTIPNVAAGNTVTVTLPVGNTYEKILLQYSGVTLEQLKNIKLELNGRLISEFADAQKIVDLDAHFDRPQSTGFVTLHFNRPELHKLGDRRFFGLDTNASQGINTASLVLDIDAAASAPKLKAFAQVAQSVPNVPNYLTKVRRFIVPVSAAGQFDIDNIPRPVGASIAAVHFFMADGADGDSDSDVTKADLLVDNVHWHDVDAKTAAEFQKQYGRKPTVAKSSVIDLITDGDITHAFPLTPNIQDMRFRCEASGAGQVEVVVEYIDLWGAGRF